MKPATDKAELPQEMRQEEAMRWIERLKTVVFQIENMGADERLAMFRYIKSRYAKDWPSDNY